MNRYNEVVVIVKRLGKRRAKTVAVAEAPREYNQRQSRAAAYDRYFELAQGWDLESAETDHHADKEEYGR